MKFQLRCQDISEKVTRRLGLVWHPWIARSTRRRISYSQLGEDIWIFRNYFNQSVSDAVLVEIGAHSGLHYSNSLLLEHITRGKTILVEPAELGFSQCLVNRPHARVYGCAISSRFEVLELLGDSAVAGIATNLSAEYIRQWNLAEATRSEVVALPLWALARIEHLEYIDVLSIDVQGSELAVLQGVDWNLPIGCLVVELEGHDEERDLNARSLLKEQGFDFRVRLGVSEIWTNRQYFRRNELFDPQLLEPVERFLTPYLEPAWRERILGTLMHSPEQDG